MTRSTTLAGRNERDLLDPRARRAGSSEAVEPDRADPGGTCAQHIVGPRITHHDGLPRTDPRRGESGPEDLGVRLFDPDRLGDDQVGDRVGQSEEFELLFLLGNLVVGHDPDRDAPRGPTHEFDRPGDRPSKSLVVRPIEGREGPALGPIAFPTGLPRQSAESGGPGVLVELVRMSHPPEREVRRLQSSEVRVP